MNREPGVLSRVREAVGWKTVISCKGSVAADDGSYTVRRPNDNDLSIVISSTDKREYVLYVDGTLWHIKNISYVSV